MCIGPGMPRRHIRPREALDTALILCSSFISALLLHCIYPRQDLRTCFSCPHAHQRSLPHDRQNNGDNNKNNKKGEIDRKIIRKHPNLKA
ncbi:hypothetical protein SISSUDRAFT_312991 [Sistotremastrum suecicum HHB10207 ss-3]|uniref:Uncharacterized protein n=1 Tax=Sistotremastrum suecicum HHB10207 ss-3 TaxID=1314776 RepID=A0A165ZBX5_9AGAM|nr:hypothetical protein SISSUDRAFT_312991 [Sistotremastrum suecicum HHB10207 ss-3]